MPGAVLIIDDEPAVSILILETRQEGGSNAIEAGDGPSRCGHNDPRMEVLAIYYFGSRRQGYRDDLNVAKRLVRYIYFNVLSSAEDFLRQKLNRVLI